MDLERFERPALYALGGLAIVGALVLGRRTGASLREETPPARENRPALPAIGTEPPAAPLSGKRVIRSRYGMRTDPVKGGGEMHRGIDLPADVGTEVYAPWDGVVARVDRVGVDKRAAYNGNAVFLATGPYRWAFLHLSEPLVSPGEAVKRGQVIGKTGNTGKSTGPHLHIQVYSSATKDTVDPETLYAADTFANPRGASQPAQVGRFAGYHAPLPGKAPIRSRHGTKGQVGIDLATPVGTEVYAPTGAFVQDVYLDPDGGGSIILASNDRAWLFQSLSQAFVRTGQYVKAGQTIALSGQDQHPDPHVHIRVFTPDGVALDPELLYSPDVFVNPRTRAS